MRRRFTPTQLLAGVGARILPEARAAIERIGAFVQSRVEPQAVR